MKKSKNKNLELKKLKIAKLNNLDAIKGGTSIIAILIRSYNPDDCANTTECPSYGCPGTTVIRR